MIITEDYVQKVIVFPTTTPSRSWATFYCTKLFIHQPISSYFSASDYGMSSMSAPHAEPDGQQGREIETGGPLCHTISWPFLLSNHPPFKILQADQLYPHSALTSSSVKSLYLHLASSENHIPSHNAAVEPMAVHYHNANIL